MERFPDHSNRYFENTCCVPNTSLGKGIGLKGDLEMTFLFKKQLGRKVSVHEEETLGMQYQTVTARRSGVNPSVLQGHFRSTLGLENY